MSKLVDEIKNHNFNTYIANIKYGEDWFPVFFE